MHPISTIYTFFIKVISKIINNQSKFELSGLQTTPFVFNIIFQIIKTEI